MIIDKRQMKFGAVSIPEINRCPTEIISSGNWFWLRKSLVDALEKKYHTDYFSKIDDCVSQTLNFLMLLGAIKELNEKIKKIELWRDWVPLTPIYEGINIQLRTMLIKHHYPNLYQSMMGGAKRAKETGDIMEGVYSHWSLTVIKECVLYTIECLEKYNLLLPEKELLEKENIQNWLRLKK